MIYLDIYRKNRCAQKQTFARTCVIIKIRFFYMDIIQISAGSDVDFLYDMHEFADTQKVSAKVYLSAHFL